MKKILFSLLMVVMCFAAAHAQTGLNGINYQAVARNSDGTVLAKQSIKVRISILGNSAGGSLQYQENHSLTTNVLGLFTLQIGKGTVSTGTFADIPWQNTNQYLKVELAIGNGSYTDLGVSQLMSVPYALYAANVKPGPQGLQGPAGSTGSKGDKGDPGLKGEKGDKGLAGVAGPAGIPGVIGAPGTAGSKGDNGDPGLKGEKGDKGLAGVAGPAGIPGVIGAPGTKGDKGDPGLKGEKGDKGLDGIAGPAGIPGAIGAPGTKGDKGDKGDPGLKGDKGDKGDQGIPGDITALSAGGDLSGTYPNPKVEKIQGMPVVATVPLSGQYLKFDGTSWAPATVAEAGLTLPYTATATSDLKLFSITNQAKGTAIEGINTSKETGASAIRGEISATNGGPNSAAVKGENKNSGNGGYGVYGTHAGSGTGVYGSVEDNGIGVYGESKGVGTGVYATSGNGIGIRAISVKGTAGTFTSYEGSALTTLGKVKLTNIGEAEGKVLTSDAAGNATWQDAGANKNIQFKVSGLRSDLITADGTTVVNTWNSTPDYNEGGGSYNPITGVYVVPADGLYQINAKLLLPAFAIPVRIGLSIVENSSVFIETIYQIAGNDVSTLQVNNVFKLTKNTVLQVRLYKSAGSATISSIGSNEYSSFSIYMIR